MYDVHHCSLSALEYIFIMHYSIKRNIKQLAPDSFLAKNSFTTRLIAINACQRV